MLIQCIIECPLSFSRFSTPEQGFPLCSQHHALGPSACDEVNSMETLYYPIIAYITWQIFYILIVSYEYCCADISCQCYIFRVSVIFYFSDVADVRLFIVHIIA